MEVKKTKIMEIFANDITANTLVWSAVFEIMKSEEIIVDCFIEPTNQIAPRKYKVSVNVTANIFDLKGEALFENDGLSLFDAKKLAKDKYGRMILKKKIEAKI